MSFSYDVSTAIGQLRLTIADSRELDDNSQRVYVFEDEELQAFLNIYQTLNGAAAAAMRSVAASKAKMEMRLRALDMDRDTKGYAAELRAMAKDFDEADNQSAGIAFAEIAVGPFGRQQRIDNEFKRGGNG